MILIPSFIVGDDLRRGALRPILNGYVGVDTSINAVCPQNRHMSAKVRVFVDFLAARFGPDPYWGAALQGVGAAPGYQAALEFQSQWVSRKGGAIGEAAGMCRLWADSLRLLASPVGQGPSGRRIHSRAKHQFR